MARIKSLSMALLTIMIFILLVGPSIVIEAKKEEEKEKGNGKDVGNNNGKGNDNDSKGNNGNGNGKGNDDGDNGNDKEKNKGDKGKDKGNSGKGNGKDKDKGNSGKGNGKDKDKGNNGKGNGKDEGKGNNGKGNGKDKDKGNNGKGKGNGGEGNGKGKGNDKSSTNYVMLDPNPATGQERFFCLAKGRCHHKTIECPSECAQRKPKKNKMNKGCFADCSSRCETTCKNRKANCNGYGSICYDPRFIGGDGTMFYFHGAKGGDFALVSDTDLHINAHFIGFRPEGRTRDFTWVQALALMFDSHTLIIAARKVSTWDNSVDSLVLRYDGKDITIPTDDDAEWRPLDSERNVIIERTDEYNSVRVLVSGLVELDVKVTPISEEEDRAHGYRLPKGDAFAHLETQFKFKGISENVEGVLGKTYQPGYVSPVKKGVAMPMMGGEDRYRTLGFLSTSCASCRFQPGGVKMVDEGANGDVLVQY